MIQEFDLDSNHNNSTVINNHDIPISARSNLQPYKSSLVLLEN